MRQAKFSNSTTEFESCPGPTYAAAYVDFEFDFCAAEGRRAIT